MKTHRYNKPLKTNMVSLITTIIVCCIFVISIVYYYTHTIINDGNIEEIKLGKNNTSAAWQIELAEINNNVVHIVGWSFFSGRDLSEVEHLPNLRVLLAETDNYDNIKYYTADYGIERPDVNEYYHDDVCYTYCGFDIEIDIGNINKDNKEFEIFIQPDERKPDLIRPCLYISNGDLTIGDNSLDVSDTDLEKIVRNGILRVCRSDIGVYVYQYDWKFYFIFDGKYPFEDWNHIGNNVYTNHSELLPEDRKKYMFASLDFNLSSCEITESMDAGQYRVCVFDIPKDYPITHMEIGQWKSLAGWGWLSSICPGIRNNR